MSKVYVPTRLTCQVCCSDFYSAEGRDSYLFGNVAVCPHCRELAQSWLMEELRKHWSDVNTGRRSTVCRF